MILKSSKLFIALAVVLSAGVFTSCNKDDDPQPALEYKTEGSVTGKITGTTRDNSYTFNDDFTYSQYLIAGGANATYIINTDGSYDFSIVRADYANSGSVALYFTLSNAGDTTPDDANIRIGYTKEIDTRLIEFTMYSEDAPNTLSITDFTFDASTGVVKGKYSTSGTNNSTNKSATVAGSFTVTTKKTTR